VGIHAGALTELVATGPCGPWAFATDASLPTGDALKDRFLKVTFGTYRVIPAGASFPAGQMEQRGTTQLYRIDHVERAGARTLIVLAEDPRMTFADGVAQETTRPGRRFEGPISFEIAVSTTEDRR
jgi:hypothetical protein